MNACQAIAPMDLRAVSSPQTIGPATARPRPDMRFRDLLGAKAWLRLPEAIRQRFGRHLVASLSVTYAGEITESRRNWIGRLLAQFSRLIGAPLPLEDDVGAPAVVTVTEDNASGGQFWMRMYGQRRGFPQVIHSSKRFAGPTGLEEYLGAGFGIALRVSADSHALHFHSHHYFLTLCGLRLSLPRLMSPGNLTISHVDLGDGSFDFILTLRHPVLGEVLHQAGRFRERVFGDMAASVPQEANHE